MPGKIILDLKFDGDYSKAKVANKIILAANQALNSGCHLNVWQWGIMWDINKKYFRTSYIEDDFTYGSILGAVIIYSNYKSDVSIEKTKVAAQILGIEYEWIQGFLYGIDGRYESIVSEIKARRSIKGQQCRDGIEIGNLLKIGYLSQDIVRGTYQPYSEENYNSHTWNDIDESKTLLSMGVIQKNRILKCSRCNMFGNTYVESYSKNPVYYISKTLIGQRYYGMGDFYKYDCDEVIIKNILE